MADDKQDPQKTDPASDPSDEEYSKKYWEAFKSTITGTLDEWWARKNPADAKDDKTPPPDPKPEQGTSRTGTKRTTLKDIVADLVFPEK